MHSAQSKINHVAFALDASDSMSDHAEKVIEVSDAQILTLAKRSEELGQETRVSIYTFSYHNKIECVLFDMDVMRLPSIRDLYHVDGMTALVDAAFKMDEDMATISRIYGEHANLKFVITDGMENNSRRHSRFELGNLVNAIPAGDSMGFLVPQDGGMSRHRMKMLGVPDDMIAEWDTTSRDGFVGAGAKVAAATESFLTSRASGRSVMRGAFSTGTEALNAATVRAAALDPMPFGTFNVAANRTPDKMEMKDFIEFQGMTYRHGSHFYELTNATRTLVQPQKQIIVRNRKTDETFTDTTPGSPRVRDLIGLSQTERKSVSAQANKEFMVFVQSTATNRHVKPGMSVLTVTG